MGGGGRDALHEGETQLNSPFKLQMLQVVAKSIAKATGQLFGGFQPGSFFASVRRAI